VDKVNTPKHYRQGTPEVIDIISRLEPRAGFLQANAIKYLMRAPYKGSYREDLEKAQWYARRALSEPLIHAWAVAPKKLIDEVQAGWELGDLTVAAVAALTGNLYALDNELIDLLDGAPAKISEMDTRYSPHEMGRAIGAVTTVLGYVGANHLDLGGRIRVRIDWEPEGA
jgi:hypothetical protein